MDLIKNNLYKLYIKSKKWLGTKKLQQGEKKVLAYDHSVMRVAFVVQMSDIWDKLSDLYELLSDKENVETCFILVPPYDMVTKQLSQDTSQCDFFTKNYPNAKFIFGVDAANGEILDIRNYQFHYIFLQRPYDHYLPQKLRSGYLARYSKVCYIPYGYSGSKVFNAGNTDPSFFCHVSYFFSDIEEICDILCKEFKKNIDKSIQHFTLMGYPALEMYLNMKEQPNQNRILWTPRWSYDKKLGGSHFLEYKDELLRYYDRCDTIQLKMRPHPLMFQNFIQTGLMTETQVDEYKELLKSKQIEISENETIDKVFEETDILITDFSSIIVMFFLTGKPIIYCPFDQELNQEYMYLYPGLYVAETWEELQEHLEHLTSGNDSKKAIRKEIIKQHFYIHKGATEKIANFLLEQFDAMSRTLDATKKL